MKRKRAGICQRNLQSLSGAGVCNWGNQPGTVAAGNGRGRSRRVYDVWFYEDLESGVACLIVSSNKQATFVK